jgi:hypothetical protein
MGIVLRQAGARKRERYNCGAMAGAITRPGRLLSACAIFVSAWLLFSVQLMMGKFVLPWFGGTPAVWNTCLFFFQVLLLGGYAYAHSRWSRPQIHLALLATSVVTIAAGSFLWGRPLLEGTWWRPGSGRLSDGHPIAGILVLLLLGVGLPFFTLSATSPLLQRWMTGEGRGIYRLYALSNVGSFLGLALYPVWLERAFTLPQQAWLWSGAFVIFAVCCAAVGMGAPAAPLREVLAESARMVVQWMWFGLAATGSVLLLASTNLITQNVAPVPLLWTVPLLIYLVTFILAFESDRWYNRGIFQSIFGVMLVLATGALYIGSNSPIEVQLAIYLLTLFVACMVVHGELARLRPVAAQLTRFYLIVAAGGAAGGFLVAIVAPLLFAGFWEYHIGLWMAAALLIAALYLDEGSWLHHQKPWLPLLMIAAIAMVPRYLNWAGVLPLDDSVLAWHSTGVGVLLGLAALLAWKSPAWLRNPQFRWNEKSLWGGLAMLAIALVYQVVRPDGRLLLRERNFYGSLEVREHGPPESPLHYVELSHGRITHGIQRLEVADRMQPTAYYNEISGVGVALRFHPRRAGGDPMRVGVIGLGAGTIAAYERPGDVYRFYDINPAVVRIARGQNGFFSFVSGAKGKTEFVLGDARLQLERELREGKLGSYDVLVVDAFNGDFIPVHLLTREAMQVYLQHLRGPDSIIAVHISNLALNLEPVVSGLAREFNLHAIYVNAPELNDVMLQSDWILLCKGDSLNADAIHRAGTPLSYRRTPPVVWTDERSELISLLK